MLLKAYCGIAFPPPDLHALCTGVPLYNRQVNTVVIARTYKRAVELLHESRVDRRITAYRVSNYWSISGNRVHEEFAMEGEAVYLCKHNNGQRDREDYVKVWPKAA